MIFAIIKLILKIFSLMDSIHEAKRVAWLNDCASAFEGLKNADTAEKKQAIAADLAKLIGRM